jgi:hypothetical protein
MYVIQMESHWRWGKSQKRTVQGFDGWGGGRTLIREAGRVGAGWLAGPVQGQQALLT